jgi:hypothetical protein
MPGTNQRTWQKYHVGHFLATFQLDPPADQRSTERHRELERVTRELIALMDAQRVPATWAVSDPAQSAATPHILRSDVAHEIAVLGDINWIGPTAGRTRFARELTRRLSQAHAAGLEVTSLVPRVASIERHMDLVVKQRITAVAGVETEPKARQLATPHALHYGVWEMPATASLPMQSSWWSSAKRSIRRSITRAAREATTVHLRIDVPEIVAEGSGQLRAITAIMRNVATYRDRGLIRVETMCSAAARLANVPAVSPQRSILRAA